MRRSGMFPLDGAAGPAAMTPDSKREMPMSPVLITMAESLYSMCRMEQQLKVPPLSLPLLAASLAAYGASEFGLALVLEHPTSVAAVGGLLAVALLSAVTAAALKLGGCGPRLPQTLIALAASGSLVSAVNIVLRMVMRTALPPQVPMSMANFLLFPLLAWNLLVYAYIFRHALSGRPVHAFAIALAYMLMLYVAFRYLTDIMAA